MYILCGFTLPAHEKSRLLLNTARFELSSNFTADGIDPESGLEMNREMFGKWPRVGDEAVPEAPVCHHWCSGY